MRLYRLLVLVGGIPLIVGAVLPWERLSIRSLGFFTGYITGLELSGGGLCPTSPAIFTAVGGAILLVVALIEKGESGTIYSRLAAVVSVLCGLFLAFIAWQLTPVVEDVQGYPSIGVFVSLVGALLGIAGGLMRVSAADTEQRVPRLTGIALLFSVFALLLYGFLIMLFPPPVKRPWERMNPCLSSVGPISPPPCVIAQTATAQAIPWWQQWGH